MCQPVVPSRPWSQVLASADSIDFLNGYQICVLWNVIRTRGIPRWKSSCLHVRSSTCIYLRSPNLDKLLSTEFCKASSECQHSGGDRRVIMFSFSIFCIGNCATELECFSAKLAWIARVRCGEIFTHVKHFEWSCLRNRICLRVRFHQHWRGSSARSGVFRILLILVHLFARTPINFVFVQG